MAALNSASRSFQFSLALLLLCNLFIFSVSRQLRLPNSWQSANGETLNTWPGRVRFNVGDELDLKLSSGESVALVNSSVMYSTCNPANATEVYNRSSGIVELNRPGPFYLISTNSGDCKAGKKMEVVVISPRRSKSGSNSSTYSAVSPSPFSNKAAAPRMSAGSSGAGRLEKKGFAVLGMMIGILFLVF